MKKDWTYKKLGECIDKIPKQKQVKSKDYKTSGLYPIVSQEKDLISGYWDDETFLFKHKKPIIIFGDHTKEIKYIDFDFVVGADGTQILSPKDDIDSKFFYYTLLATPLRTLGYARHFKLLKEKLFKIPPLSEQSRIVSRLDAAFGEIEGLKAKAEAQLREARTLFQAALTQEMKPKQGWEEKKLPDISENLDGKRKPVTKKDRTQGIYPYYGASGIVDYVDDYLFDEDLLCISEDGANLLMRTYPIAFPISGKVWVNNHAHVLRFNCMTTQRYVEYFFAGKKLDEYITGAAQPKLTQKALNNIPIYIPDNIDQQARIVSRLDALSEKVRELEEAQKKDLAECDALKQALLREVFE